MPVSLRACGSLLLALTVAALTPASASSVRDPEDGWLQVSSAVGGDETWVHYRWQERGRVRRGVKAWVQHRVADEWRTVETIRLGRPRSDCARGICGSFFRWDSREVPAGRRLLRLVVAEPLFPASRPAPVWIDHAPPSVRIKEPRGARVVDLPDGERGFSVQGQVSFSSDVFDKPTGAHEFIGGHRYEMNGMRAWRWTFRNDVTGERWVFEPFEPDPFPYPRFDFDAHPGSYTVTAEFQDAAGNWGSDSVRVVGRPRSPDLPIDLPPRPCPPAPATPC